MIDDLIKEISVQDSDKEFPSDDMSYIIVAVDNSGSYFIIDAAQGFTDRELIQMHQIDEDTGVKLPTEITNPGTYKLINPSIEASTDWESGLVDEVWVVASEFETLWEQT